MSNSPFYFYTQLHHVNLLGVKARNPVELLEGIKTVPALSIYYHTHRFLQLHQHLSPEPPNDFAYWLTNILNIKELGEAVASVDFVSFKNMEELRTEFIKILKEYISNGNRLVECPPGHQFHFMTCVTFVLPTSHVANNLREFVESLKKITISSLYFHMFEARMRIERDDNDFSAWFDGIGETELGKEISRIDPYTITLESLREKIIRIVNKYAGN